MLMATRSKFLSQGHRETPPQRTSDSSWEATLGPAERACATHEEFKKQWQERGRARLTKGGLNIKILNKELSGVSLAKRLCRPLIWLSLHVRKLDRH